MLAYFIYKMYVMEIQTKHGLRTFCYENDIFCYVNIENIQFFFRFFSGYANIKGKFNFIILQTLWEHYFLMYSERSETHNILKMYKCDPGAQNQS